MKSIAILRRAFEVIQESGLGFVVWTIYTYIFLCWQNARTEWFPIHISTFEKESGVSNRSIKKFRPALEKLGLIEYKRGTHGRLSQYKITEAK